MRAFRSGALGGVEALTARETTHRFPRHAHDTFVIQVVDHGVVAFECAGARYEAGPGDLILLNPEAAHTGAPSGAEAVAYRSVYPSPATMRRALGGVDARRGFESLSAMPRVTRDAELRLLLLAAHGAMVRGRDALGADSALLLLLAAMVERWGGATAADASARRRGSAGVRRAVHAAQARFTERLTLDDLAGAADLSPFHLVRAFKVETGMTPHEYVLNLRVRAAKRMLRAGTAPAAAATACGFFDQSHLHRWFRRMVGVTPGAYRRAHAPPG